MVSLVALRQLAETAISSSVLLARRYASEVCLSAMLHEIVVWVHGSGGDLRGVGCVADRLGVRSESPCPPKSCHSMSELFPMPPAQDIPYRLSHGEAGAGGTIYLAVAI